MQISEFLKEAVVVGASDIILSAESFPSFKINSKIVFLDKLDKLNNKDLQKDIFNLMNTKQKETFKNNKELDFSIELKGISRFRTNVFWKKQGIAIIFRPIVQKIRTVEELGITDKLVELTNKKNGLILVTGSVGSGKSTTLTTLIDYINTNNSKHIITIEDPIEYVYENKKSLIEQREVGVHTNSFENGLKYALRQASDVIMIGEMRDLETIRLALRSAETGNLVLATLHTSGASNTISRIIDIFPGDEKEQIKAQISESLLGVIWQDLIPTKDGQARVLSSELMINNSNIANMIRKGNFHQIDGAIETGKDFGMYTMKSSLEKLKSKDLID